MTVVNVQHTKNMSQISISKPQKCQSNFSNVLFSRLATTSTKEKKMLKNVKQKITDDEIVNDQNIR